jgi:hypothetical protein
MRREHPGTLFVAGENADTPGDDAVEAIVCAAAGMSNGDGRDLAQQ